MDSAPPISRMHDTRTRRRPCVQLQGQCACVHMAERLHRAGHRARFGCGIGFGRHQRIRRRAICHMHLLRIGGPDTCTCLHRTWGWGSASLPAGLCATDDVSSPTHDVWATNGTLASLSTELVRNPVFLCFSSFGDSGGAQQMHHPHQIDNPSSSVWNNFQQP